MSQREGKANLPTGGGKTDARVGLGLFAPGFVLGVCLLQWLPALPDPRILLAVLVPLLVFYRRMDPLRWIAPLALGFVWAWSHAAWYLQGAIAPELEGRDLTLVGVVTGLPEPRGSGTRFTFDVHALEGVKGEDGEQRARRFSGSVRLTWYRGAPELWAGERWRLRVRLKAPHGFSNPGGFDYEGWLFRQGIRATGYVRADPANERLAAAGWGVDALRQEIRERLHSSVDDSGALGLIQALVLGDRSGIGQEQWEVLTRTGTNHLIAISGLHVGILAGLAFFLVRWSWRRSLWLIQRLAADRAAAVGALLAAAGYAALAGFSVSTQRALIMLAVVFGAVLLRRTLRPATGLLAALTLVLVLDPMASLSYGFWLSFAAVAVLLYGMGRRVGAGGLLWRWGRAQWLVALGLLPLLLLMFGRASVVAPLVNLLAVPLFSTLLLPWVLLSALLAVTLELQWPLSGAAWLLTQGFAGLEWLASQPWAAWTLPDQPVWAWLLAFAGVALLLAPRGLPGRWTGAVMLLPLFLIQPAVPGAGAFRFTLLDVGQGLAAVIQTHRHLLLFDTGPLFSSGFNTGAAVIAPFLRARGLRRIDRLVVSHGDKDHAGGLAGLAGTIPMGEILSGEPGELRGVSAELCRSGMEWSWDGVRFRILHPGLPLPASSNNRSCILQVQNGSGSVLITGDAEVDVERRLAAELGGALRSSVLVAGHHGSDTSTSDAFLREVAPEYVLFSAGYRNRYGFPRPRVQARVAAASAAALDTSHGGAIELLFPREGLLTAPRSHRRERRRYWTHAP